MSWSEKVILILLSMVAVAALVLAAICWFIGYLSDRRWKKMTQPPKVKP